MRVAAVPPGGGDIGHQAAVPRVLSEADAKRYARIFAVQEHGHWADAERLIAKLDDRILMGHVLAQKYLHPTAYRSKFGELARWLDSYADHPHARRIHRLALRRKPADAKAPRRPVAPDQPAAADGGEPRIDGYVSPRQRSATERQALVNLLMHIRGHIARGDTAGAAKHLDGPKLNRLADDVEYDIIRAEVAYLFFIAGDDARALALAAASAARSGDHAPLADWTAGLAAYRAGDLETARRHFESLALNADADVELRDGGAYWAARVNLITRRPERVSRLLRIAAEAPRTFYGLLAARALGDEIAFAWENAPLTDRDLAIVMRIPAVVRAVALVEAGQPERAELELKRLRTGASAALAKATLALATRLDLPAAQLRIARELAALDGRRHDGAMYPLPQWTPDDGFDVDRALIYALIRQESAFNAYAKSHAGARGLMQLMPRTASFIGRDRGLRSSRRHHLYHPEFNIALGQKYVLHLLRNETVGGNLLFAVAAYNGGPGNLRKWLKSMAFDDDPLLFMESLPARETRAFVKQVLTNLWIYRARLAEPSPSLDAMAGGRWPLFRPVDGAVVARTVDARD